MSLSVGHTETVVMRVWLVATLVVVIVVAGLAGAALLAWPQGSLAPSSSGIVQVSLPGFAGDVDGVQVVGSGGRPVQVVLRNGAVFPLGQLAQGRRLTVTVEIARPQWIGWLVGRRVTRTLAVVTPSAQPSARLLSPKRGAHVVVPYSTPVARVRIGRQRSRTLSTPASFVPLGRVAAGATSSGTLLVAVAPRPWERLGAPVRVSWFVRGTKPQAELVVAPAAGAVLWPGGQLTLTFSRPVAEAIGSRLPRIGPATPGHWTQEDANTLVFEPGALGFPLGAALHVTLPRPALIGGRSSRVITWHVRPGSELRLQQLLARLDYLPLRWHSSADPSKTPASELAEAVRPPAGSFSWRYAKIPSSLTTLWRQGQTNDITRGAVMEFENEHGMATDGIAGPAVWRALMKDDLADRLHLGGYSYVFVHATVPESLNLWHNGKVILTSPGNTGIPSAPTPFGTWPVFEHIPVGTMSGTNPDGTHYDDPGIRWISYFHGGDALHAFPRASYGTPQSLGCVELPEDDAAKVWPYTPIGTLVTVES